MRKISKVMNFQCSWICYYQTQKSKTNLNLNFIQKTCFKSKQNPLLSSQNGFEIDFDFNFKFQLRENFKAKFNLFTKSNQIKTMSKQSMPEAPEKNCRVTTEERDWCCVIDSNNELVFCVRSHLSSSKDFWCVIQSKTSLSSVQNVTNFARKKVSRNYSLEIQKSRSFNRRY